MDGIDAESDEKTSRVRPVFSEATRRDLPILLHYGIENVHDDPGNITPEALDVFVEELLLKSPGLNVQFAHSIGPSARPRKVASDT